MTPLVRELIGLAPDAVPDAVWFDGGILPRKLPLNIRGPLATTPLPFERCAIAMLSEERHKLLYIVIDAGAPSNVVSMFGYVMMPGDYIKCPHIQFARHDGEIRMISTQEGEDRITAGVMLGALQHFLQQANPEGYRGTPKTNSLINRKRAAKGKPPLQYDWHTVTVEPPKPKGESKGGTHASPRLHDRRGHWRTYPSGKKGWVKACKVGDGSKGAVFKDYKIKEQE